MTIKSQPATDAYRSGWDRVFGGDVRPPPLRTIMNQEEMRASIKAERLQVSGQDPSMDIVDRLRERAGQYDEYDWHGAIEREAADEIERLRELTKAV